MCQYCGNTGLCYFLFSYGFVWLIKKISLFLREKKLLAHELRLKLKINQKQSRKF